MKIFKKKKKEEIKDIPFIEDCCITQSKKELFEFILDNLDSFGIQYNGEKHCVEVYAFSDKFMKVCYTNDINELKKLSEAK